MGEQLVLDLADEWHPERYKDEFKKKLEELVEVKRKAGDVTKVVEMMGEEIAPTSADVIDLTELLQRSLKAGPGTGPKKKAPVERARTKKAANDDEVTQRAAAASKSAGKARTAVKPKRQET